MWQTYASGWNKLKARKGVKVSPERKSPVEELIMSLKAIWKNVGCKQTRRLFHPHEISEGMFVSLTNHSKYIAWCLLKCHPDFLPSDSISNICELNKLSQKYIVLIHSQKYIVMFIRCIMNIFSYYTLINILLCSYTLWRSYWSDNFPKDCYNLT